MIKFNYILYIKNHFYFNYESIQTFYPTDWLNFFKVEVVGAQICH